MSPLLILMLESLVIIIAIAFVMTRIGYVRQLIYQSEINIKTQLSIIVIFGLFGVVGTYTGITFNSVTEEAARWEFGLGENEAIINFRVLGIVTAGLLGGFRIGLGAGLIAGVHRYLLGGYSAFACGLATVFVGILAGLISARLNQSQRLNPLIAMSIAIVAESIQMVIVFIFAQPFNQMFDFSAPKSNALILVENIAWPMIILNGIGCGIFILIVRSIIREEDNIGAMQAKTALRLARLTVEHLRKGLNNAAAKASCSILLEEVKALAVAMTDQNSILAHVGVAADHHLENRNIMTTATREVLQYGAVLIVKTGHVKCEERHCPLRAAIIAPLKCRNTTVGTIKFYYRSDREISNITIELVSGISELLSMQLDLAEAEHQKRLAKEAEIKVILTEDVIHFIGNAMTAVNYLIRTDPLKARQLVNWITRYVKKGLDKSSHKWTTIGEELDHIKNYLSIHEVTYAGRLIVNYQVDESAMQYQIPPLILMTLVDNAIKYSVKETINQSYINIRIKSLFDLIVICITDSGKGIAKNKLDKLGNDRVESKDGTGLGLFNVNRLLYMMYGAEASLRFESKPGSGTKVFVTIPKIKIKEVHDDTNKIAHYR